MIPRIPNELLMAALAGQQQQGRTTRHHLGDGLLATGLSMMANSSTPGATFASSFGKGALEEGIPAFQRSQYSAQEKVALDEMLQGAPPEMQAMLRALGPQGAASVMLQQMMMPEPEVDRDIERQADGTLAVIENGELARTIGPPTDTSAEDEEVTFRRTDSLADDFFRETQVHRDTADAVSKALSASESAVGDQTRVIALNKLLDPGSIVRESEFDRVGGAGGLAARAQWYYSQMVDGKLPENLRAQIDAEIQSQVQGAEASFAPSYERFRFRAESSGLDPAQVTQDWYAPVRGMLQNMPTREGGDPLSIRR